MVKFICRRTFPKRRLAGGRCRQISFPGWRQDSAPGYLDVSGQLRLAYSQFEELETFARFGTRLDDTLVTISSADAG